MDPKAPTSSIATVLIVGSALLVGFCVVATALAFIRTDAWHVRVFDFPRVQILLLASSALALLAAAWLVAPGLGVALLSGRVDLTIRLGAAAAGIGVILIQATYIIPYTTVQPAVVPTSSSSNLSLLITNIDYRNSLKDDALQVLQEQGPDVLVLIEIDEAWAVALSPLRDKYPNRIESVLDHGLGIALWSKLPLQDSSIEHLVTEDRPSVFATILLPSDDRVRLACIHPTPPGLDKRSAGGRHDSEKRDTELHRLAEQINSSQHGSWIVVGDFNDVAWSRTTRQFQQDTGLLDPRVGRGLFNTYHAEYALLRYPLDHVFVPAGTGVAELSRLRLPGSDHFAMSASMNIGADRSERNRSGSSGHGSRQEQR